MTKSTVKYDPYLKLDGDEAGTVSDLLEEMLKAEKEIQRIKKLTPDQKKERERVAQSLWKKNGKPIGSNLTDD